MSYSPSPDPCELSRTGCSDANPIGPPDLEPQRSSTMPGITITFSILTSQLSGPAPRVPPTSSKTDTSFSQTPKTSSITLTRSTSVTDLVESISGVYLSTPSNVFPESASSSTPKSTKTSTPGSPLLPTSNTPVSDAFSSKVHPAAVVLVGVGIGATLAAILIIFIALWACRRSRVQRKDQQGTQEKGKSAILLEEFELTLWPSVCTETNVVTPYPITGSNDLCYVGSGSPESNATRGITNPSDSDSANIPLSESTWWKHCDNTESQSHAPLHCIHNSNDTVPALCNTSSSSSAQFMATGRESSVLSYDSSSQDRRNSSETARELQNLELLPVSNNLADSAHINISARGLPASPPIVDERSEYHSLTPLPSQTTALDRSRSVSTFQTTGTAPPPYSAGQSSDRLGEMAQNAMESERSTAAAAYADMMRSLVPRKSLWGQ